MGSALTEREFDEFLLAAGCSSTLEEIEVHRNDWLHELNLPAECPRLRVVRASECANLEALPTWKGWRALEHVDLRNDARLSKLPKLPLENLRYLGLHRCDLLRTYLRQDLNERDLGVRREDNAADNFSLRMRLGPDTRERPRCKLLLLGNGRGGKTTLSKALQFSGTRSHPERRPPRAC